MSSLLDIHRELPRRLKRRDSTFGNNDGLFLGYIAGCFLCTLLYYEATETTQVHILAANERILDTLHKRLHYDQSRLFIDASALGYFAYYLSLCHNSLYLYFMVINHCSFRIAKIEYSALCTTIQYFMVSRADI